MASRDRRLVCPTQPGAVVGTAIVGTTKIASGDVWTDITGYVRGLEIDRGSNEFDQRGDPGTLELRLKSPDHIFAPWLDTLDSFNGSGRKFQPGL